MMFPMKNSVLDNYPSCLPAQAPPVLDNYPSCLPAQAPPEKRKFYFYCRLAFSDKKTPSEKGVSRRCPERPLGEYDRLGVGPYL